MLENALTIPAAPSFVGNWASIIGVSMGPNAIAFTRMWRSLSSAAQLRVNERMAAFVAAYAPYGGNPFR